MSCLLRPGFAILPGFCRPMGGHTGKGRHFIREYSRLSARTSHRCPIRWPTAAAVIGCLPRRSLVLPIWLTAASPMWGKHRVLTGPVGWLSRSHWPSPEPQTLLLVGDPVHDDAWVPQLASYQTLRSTEHAMILTTLRYCIRLERVSAHYP